jgi:hypothetical protein
MNDIFKFEFSEVVEEFQKFVCHLNEVLWQTNDLLDYGRFSYHSQDRKHSGYANDVQLSEEVHRFVTTFQMAKKDSHLAKCTADIISELMLSYVDLTDVLPLTYRQLKFAYKKASEAVA